jgi:geranylgeranyl reductase family protein
MKHAYDVIVVGAGPAGSVAAWALARRGIAVLVLDRAHFPREKVCGDYVEPRGLRVLAGMGCLGEVAGGASRAVSQSALYVDGARRYGARIPFYVGDGLPPHGYVIPRATLDHVLLRAALRAGAHVRHGVEVTEVLTGSRGVAVTTRGDARARTYRGSLVVGADGVHSMVARCAGLLANDCRHVVLSQRVYAEGLDAPLDEARIFFERHCFPGYGWVFPMAGDRVNLGVGMLAETSRHRHLRIPQLFTWFVERIKSLHPPWANLRFCRAPVGGVVKTYGGAGRNHFDGGLLVGDAGSFVDPMTGEGIAPAMESSLLAAVVLEAALESGRFDAGFLSHYERVFRAYFDCSMVFLDLCAAAMRNQHLSDSWLRTLAEGCQVAQTDMSYTRTVGAVFGGLSLRPSGVLAQLWTRMAADWLTLAPRTVAAGWAGRPSPLAAWARDLVGWQRGWWSSWVGDPSWHAGWTRDLDTKWRRALAIMRSGGDDPRATGVLSLLSDTVNARELLRQGGTR